MAADRVWGDMNDRAPLGEVCYQILPGQQPDSLVSSRPQPVRPLRCVSGISDKSTRKTALQRAFSARNASSLSQFVKIGMRSTTFQRHFFRVLARDLKPGAHFGALDVLFGESHRPLF